MNRLTDLLKKLLLLIALVVLGGGVAVYSGMPQVGADGAHGTFTGWLLQTVRERSVARSARAIDVRLPERLDGDALLASVSGFEDMCASCHAPPGRSPSALAEGLNPPAPDLARAARQRSAAELFWVTRHGIRMSGMPAWGRTHPDTELWQLVALMRRLPEIDGAEYERLLAAARAAGIVHEHDHEHEQEHEHEH